MQRGARGHNSTAGVQSEMDDCGEIASLVELRSFQFRRCDPFTDFLG